jgi:hypothetical protein
MIYLSVRGHPYTRAITATLICYARSSTDRQDLTAQHQRLLSPGVANDRIYLDHSLTGEVPPLSRRLSDLVQLDQGGSLR